jgi:hypothetical protein
MYDTVTYALKGQGRVKTRCLILQPCNDNGGTAVYISHELDLVIALLARALINTNRVDPEPAT